MDSDADILLLQLPSNGDSLGNVTLRESLEWDEARYAAPVPPLRYPPFVPSPSSMPAAGLHAGKRAPKAAKASAASSANIGIEADFGKELADTFRNVQHPDLSRN